LKQRRRKSLALKRGKIQPDPGSSHKSRTASQERNNTTLTKIKRISNHPFPWGSLSPNNSVTNSLAEHIARHPRSIKLAKQLRSLLGRFPLITRLLPRQLTILEQSLPDATNDSIIRPNNVAENLIISLNPHRPKIRAFNKWPNTLKFLETDW
jgi:hypothetical protein